MDNRGTRRKRRRTNESSSRQREGTVDRDRDPRAAAADNSGNNHGQANYNQRDIRLGSEEARRIEESGPIAMNEMNIGETFNRTIVYNKTTNVHVRGGGNRPRRRNRGIRERLFNAINSLSGKAVLFFVGVLVLVGAIAMVLLPNYRLYSLFSYPTSEQQTKAPRSNTGRPTKASSRSQSTSSSDRKSTHGEQKTEDSFALHEACRLGKFEDVVELLQEDDININQKNPSRDSALHIASAGGRISIVKQLLRHGASVDVFNRLGRTPLHEASTNGHAEVVEMLCENNATVNVIDLHGKTPLAEASVRGYKTIVQILTYNEADANTQNTMSIRVSPSVKPNIPKLPVIELPLMSAVTMGYDEIVALLLLAGAHVNVPNSDGWTELHMAAYNGNFSIVEMLIENGADVHAVTELGATPLCLASQEGHERVVSYLIDHGADVNHTQQDGATSLMLASQAGHDKVAEILLKSKAATTATIGGNSTSALQLAVQGGHSQTVTVLIRYPVAEMGLAAKLLHLASFRGEANVVKHLLATGINPDVKMDLGQTPLMLAAMNGHSDVVKLLLQHGADPKVSIEDDIFTPLSAAVHYSHTDVVKLILDLGPDDLVDVGYGPYHITLLESALLKEKYEIFSILLDHGADPALKESKNRWPKFPVLCTAVAWSKTAFVKRLLSHNKVNPDQPCFSTLTSLSIAVNDGHVAITDLLLDYGASHYITFPGSTHISVLGFAAYEGKSEIVELLINRTFDVETTDDVCTFPLTPLGLAAMEGHANVVKTLLAHGANVDANGTPLYMATEFGHTDVVEILLQHGANVELPNKQGGVPPLILATERGHIDIVKLLLDHGANMDAKFKIFKPVSETVQRLNVLNEEYGDIMKEHFDANENKDTSKQYSHIAALHLATTYNNTEMVKLLVERGANTEIQYSYLNYHHVTPLHLACLFGFKQVAEILLRGGANVHSKAYDGVTSLHLAYSLGHTDIVALLLKHGADRLARDSFGDLFFQFKYDEEQRNIFRAVVNHNMELKRAWQKGRNKN